MEFLKVSQRASKKALWMVEPLPGRSSAARAKGRGKMCMIDHSVYHRNLSDEEQKEIFTTKTTTKRKKNGRAHKVG